MALTQDPRDKMGDADGEEARKRSTTLAPARSGMLLPEDRPSTSCTDYPCIQVEHPVTEVLDGSRYGERADSDRPGAKLSVKLPIERRGHVLECPSECGGSGPKIPTVAGTHRCLPSPAAPEFVWIPTLRRRQRSALLRCASGQAHLSGERPAGASPHARWRSSFIIEASTTIPFLARVNASKAFPGRRGGHEIPRAESQLDEGASECGGLMFISLQLKRKPGGTVGRLVVIVDSLRASTTVAARHH